MNLTEIFEKWYKITYEKMFCESVHTLLCLLISYKLLLKAKAKKTSGKGSPHHCIALMRFL